MKMVNIRQTVLETLSRAGPLRVQAIARQAHLSPTAMRYHLVLLEKDGLIASREVNSEGKVGRPQLEYALAEAASERLPKKYAELASHLIDALAQAVGPKATRATLRAIGRRAAAGAGLPRGSAERRFKRTTQFLNEHGYMARWCKSSDRWSLNICNCPFRQVALKHREVCDMDTAMIGALVGTPLRMTHCIAHDDGQCELVTLRKGARAIR